MGGENGFGNDYGNRKGPHKQSMICNSSIL